MIYLISMLTLIFAFVIAIFVYVISSERKRKIREIELNKRISIANNRLQSLLINKAID